jgi:uncharacterized membrane protein
MKYKTKEKGVIQMNVSGIVDFITAAVITVFGIFLIWTLLTGLPW